MNSKLIVNNTRPTSALVKAVHLLSIATLVTMLALGIVPARVAQATTRHASNTNASAVTVPIRTNDKSNPANGDHVSGNSSGMGAPPAQASYYTYSITLPDHTFVVMGDQAATLPFTVASDAASSGNIDSVTIGVPPSVYWVSTATAAPDGWVVTEIKNAGSGQAWVHFEPITTTNAITPGGNITFNVVVVGNQFGIFPSSDRDETDTLDFATVEGVGRTVTFTRSGPLPEWERKALAVNLSTSPSSLGVDSLVNVTMNVFNRSTITQTSVVPTTTVVSGSGGVTLTTGPTPTELSIPPGEAAPFTWTYTATASGDVVFSNSASNSVASSVSDQSNTVLIGDFTAALNLEPTQIISGQLTTINMTVKNNAASAITNVTPSVLGLLGTATTTLSSGPNPASVALLYSGATAAFEWVYTTTGDIGATYQFTGTASTGNGITSNVPTSPQGVIKKYTVSVMPRYAPIGTLTQTLKYVVANNGGSSDESVEFSMT